MLLNETRLSMSDSSSGALRGIRGPPRWGSHRGYTRPCARNAGRANRLQRMRHLGRIVAMRLGSVLVAIALPLLLPGRALGLCSPSALEAVHAELRAAIAPRCGPKALRRAFNRARHKGAIVTARAVIRCADAGTPHTASAHRALMKALAKVTSVSATGTLPPSCALAYETELQRLDADLTAAEAGIEPTTTTTSPPGAPTTTTLQRCTTINLEVDRGDCTSVTSDPPGLVGCGPTCHVATFSVPGFGLLRLVGTPAPGDSTVSFGTDCGDDGTVPFADASPPDCSLSCDCSSGL